MLEENVIRFGTNDVPRVISSSAGSEKIGD
jgi:hypothetical protein